MPRIRKKTSKRGTTRQRAKIKHKVAESRKKSKKLAKKNPQWKSKKPKDPGIPNEFPYKDQILAEVAETRRQAEEAKQRLKEEKKAARLGLLVPDTDGEVVEPEEGPSSPKGPPLLFNPDLPNLKAVLAKANVVLHVLDARDPISYCLTHIEDTVLSNPKSKLVWILNKIDLVPRETLGAWMKKLRAQHSTFLFRSASLFLPKTPTSDPKAKGKAKETALDSIGSEALLKYLGQQATAIEGETLQVAVVGLTNSGKSAIVNSLAHKSVVPVYAPSASTDAWATTTTRAYEVTVDVAGHRLNLIDTPGVALRNEHEHNEALKIRDMLLRCRGRVDRVKEPIPVVEHIEARANTEDLMLQYNLPAFTKGDCTAFLAGISRAHGLLKKGGTPDLTYAARLILRDWTTGKFPFCTEPPPPMQELTAAAQQQQQGEARDAESTDTAVLAAVRTRREMRMRGGVVRLVAPGEVETRRVDLEKPFVLEDVVSESGSDEGEGDEEGDEEDDGEEGDEGDAEEDPEDDDGLEHLLPSGKRKRKANAAARPVKKVAFVVGTRDRAERKRVPIPKASKLALKKKAAAAATESNDAYDFDQFFKK